MHDVTHDFPLASRHCGYARRTKNDTIVMSTDSDDAVRSDRCGSPILGTFIDTLDWDQCLGRIAAWAAARESRAVSICNVHSLVTATKDIVFRRALDDSDMATPDGMPVVWALRNKGHSGQTRLDGPTLMWRYLGLAEKLGQSVYFYGSKPTTLERLCIKTLSAYPALRIAGSYSPPFRELTEDERREDIERINNSGANVVFVALGCPKQEKWILAHKGKVRAVMIGVGAAFAFHAGVVRRAPKVLQDLGLEWLYRLTKEPTRLMSRYVSTNVSFLAAWATGRL